MDKEEIIKNLTWKSFREASGPKMRSDITLCSAELGIEIYINQYISPAKNKNLAFKLFEIALDEIMSETSNKVE